MPPEGKEQKRNDLLRKYIGFASQLVIGIGIAVWGGIWLDRRFPMRYPLFAWLLPLLVIFATLVKVIKDISRKD